MSIQEELIVTQKKVKKLEEEIRKLNINQKKYECVLNNVKEVIFQTDINGSLIYLNRTWVEIMGYSSEESIGICFFNFIHVDDKKLAIRYFNELMEKKIEHYRQVIRYITKDGRLKWSEIYATLLLDGSNNIVGSSGTINDVTERILMEHELTSNKEQLEKLVENRTKELNEVNGKLSYLSTHDGLTNVSNRHFLEEALYKAIIKIRNEAVPSSLMCMDLDNFKIINDTYGHSIGDEVLVRFTDLLRKIINVDNVVARLGGDEFAVLLCDTPLEKASQIGESIRKEIEGIYIEVSPEVATNATISVGIVNVDETLTPQEILSYADTALGYAKDGGKNRITAFKSDDDKTKLYEFNNTVRLIKRAIQYNHFILYYQPIIKVRGRILHYEALIRMIGKKGEIIPPGQFIPVAEQCGLMSQIDKWVVKDVIKTLEENPHISVFINLSGLSLGDKALLSFIEESISNSRIEPAQLGFEITETSAVKDLSQSQQWIRRLKQLGCRFALDDFGVGFSSFTYLGNLPVDYLKIDGSFVKTLDKDPTQKALIQAMNAVAHVLGKQTIAEFVENREILKILQELNVDCGQGYYIGKPRLMGK